MVALGPRLPVESRAGPLAVGLETTLLVHGVPANEAPGLCAELSRIVRDGGAEPALVGVVAGRCVAGMTPADLREMLRRAAAGEVAKANTSNLGILLHAGAWGATTVSGTMEICAGAGIRVFSTGGLGGVHRGYGVSLDISADLAAFTRFPVAVVASGVKSILDVSATREALETLGVPVVGFGTDRFPAFFVRESEARTDARFDDVSELAGFLAFELRRTGRGIVVANPVPEEAAIPEQRFCDWLAEARARTRSREQAGRDVTPSLLATLVEVSDGATLAANLALVRANAHLAARIRAAMGSADPL